MTATVDSSGSAAPTITAFPDHWSEDRIAVAREATGQIEHLCYMLRSVFGDDWSPLLESTVVRIKDLNSVTMSLVSVESSRDTHEMEHVVYGLWAGGVK